MTHRSLVHRPPSNAAQHPGENRSRTGALTKLRTIDETANLLSVSPRTVRRLIGSGALRAHHIGRLVRISDNEIATLLRSDCRLTGVLSRPLTSCSGNGFGNVGKTSAN